MGLVAFRWKGRFSVSSFFAAALAFRARSVCRLADRRAPSHSPAQWMSVCLPPSVREDLALMLVISPLMSVWLVPSFRQWARCYAVNGGVGLGESDGTPVRLRQLVGRFRHPVSCRRREVEEGIGEEDRKGWQDQEWSLTKTRRGRAPCLVDL